MKPKSRAMLLELAELLESLPEERFNYSHWAGSDWQGDPDLSCGTTACAAGWAATLPSFRERGLRLVPRSDGVFGANIVCGLRYGTGAMAAALNISEGDAAFLFIPSYFHGHYRRSAPHGDGTAVEVAAHIRQYVADQDREGAEPQP